MGNDGTHSNPQEFSDFIEGKKVHKEFTTQQNNVYV